MKLGNSDNAAAPKPNLHLPPLAAGWQIFEPVPRHYLPYPKQLYNSFSITPVEED
jgi:hypothetical protein